MPDRCAGGGHLESVNGERVHTAVAPRRLHQLQQLLNRYQNAQANTILNNLHSVPTDTPIYEKRPYTADAHLAADSAIANFDMENFYESWMRAHRDDQNRRDRSATPYPAPWEPRA